MSFSRAQARTAAAPMAAHMAKQVRGLTAYDPLEKFDLGGFTQEQVAEFIPLAFREPFALTLRVSFVVGGGRLVRAKYHEDLQKWLSAALRELGFDEDRGAALGSQEAFKRQEDLAQNLVFFHVFPRYAKPEAAEGGGGGGGGGEEAPAAPPSPAQRLAACSLEELKRMAPSKIMTFTEKRRAQDVLAAAVARIDALEAKMASRAQMSEAEVEEYGALNREGLEEKAKWLQGECKAHVAGGLLTAAEYATILKEMGEKLAAMTAEAARLPAGDKRSEAAGAKIAELAAKREATAGASARAVMPPLRGAAELVKARSALERLRRMEKEKSGKLLSVAEAQQLGQMPELEARIQGALADARGFFETDDEFALRLQNAASAAGGGGGGGGKKR